MRLYYKLLFIIMLFVTVQNYAQLGFCAGSKGDPIFSESFGTDTNYGPALPAGTTNYPFIAGSPNDGFYTLFYRTDLYSTWHYSVDHTPDSTNGSNGKCLIVNANASTTGDFYKRTVSGLCINSTFEFSAWLLNVYNPGSGFCGANEIPINVRFEIWNATETVLLSAGNTGNLSGTSTPIWQQFDLVFTTANETAVVLKMKNNGVGGCGNDLAIDDIEFRFCGDLTTVSNTSAAGNTFSFCDNSGPLTLQATAAGSATYFYQWQTSTNGFIWSDILGATNATYTTPSANSLTYYRTKVAQDATNLSNNFCSALSSVFTLLYQPAPSNATSNGDIISCSTAVIPPISVVSVTGTNVNWYDAPTNGNLLQANSLSYTPTAAGTFYAETYSLASGCKSTSRTAVTVSIVQPPTASFTGNVTYCSDETTAITLQSSIVGTTFSWTVSQNGTLGATAGNGSTINQMVQATTASVGSATYYVTPKFNGCDGPTIPIVINIQPMPKPAIVDGVVCLNASSAPNSQFYNLATGLSSTDFSFKWFYNGTVLPLVNTNSYNTNQIGTYSVIATNNTTGCISKTTNATVSQSVQGTGLIITQSENFSDNQTITIGVIGGGGPYYYKLDTGSFQSSAVFSFVTSGSHIVTVTGQYNCTYLTQVINIINYPHFFTPNGDGYNDFWNIEGLAGNFDVSIFDRFGKLIKQISTNSDGWNGTYNNQNLPADDYWFVINYTEKGVEKKFKSHFSLKR